MEMGGELEDDLFYADLSKQISLLILDDDDDDDDDEDPLANCSSVSLQAFSHAIKHPPLVQQAQHMLLHHEQRCRREQPSKGTGVFIPQSNIPRRKQRQSRFNHNHNHNNHINNHNHNHNHNYYNNSYCSKTNYKQQQQQHVVVHDDNNNTQQHHKMVVTSNASCNSKFGATA